MALSNSKIFNGVKGKIERLVFYYAKGQQRIRTLTTNAPPPPTNTRILQNNRMRACVSFYHANRRTPIPDIWKKAAAGGIASGYNLFVKANIRHFNLEHRICDYSTLRLTAGTLEMPSGWQMESAGKGEARVRWHNCLPLSSERQNDRLCALWLKGNGSFELQLSPQPAALRRDEEALLTLPEENEAEWHLYLYFAARDGERFSENRYFFIKSKK